MSILLPHKEVQSVTLEILLHQLVRLLHQVMQAEVMVLLLAEVLIQQHLVDRLTAARPTIGQQEQIEEEVAILQQEEVGLLHSIRGTPQAGQAPIAPLGLVRQVDQAQEVVLALQVEVQEGPQGHRAREDQEEGGINSPLFFTSFFIQKTTLLR